MKNGYLYKLPVTKHMKLLHVQIEDGRHFSHEEYSGSPGGIHLYNESGTTTLVVNGGYAWDGCTPKWDLFGVLFGTPEGAPRKKDDAPSTYLATLVHDCMYQHHVVLKKELNISRYDIDKEFQLQLKDAGMPLWMRTIYYCAVRSFGWIWYHFVR